jgi:poly(A) polymerase
VTTLRVDVETDGRRARVAFTDDWRMDAARRDLTINALSAEMSGHVHDYFGGLEDLAHGRVRFVGDPAQRIAEDHLRLLRFFRFHAEFAAGDYDAASFSAAKAMAHSLRALSAERLRQETLRLLVARRGPEVWGEMMANGVVEAYLPWATSLDRLRDLAERERRLGLSGDPVRRLAALTMTGCGDDVAAALRLSNAESERIRDLAAMRPIFDVRSAKSVRRQIYDLGNQAAEDRLLIDWPEEKDEALCRSALVQVRNWKKPSLPVGGKDLARLGIEPGPKMGELLRRLEAWWIEGDFTADRVQCVARLTSLCLDRG